MTAWWTGSAVGFDLETDGKNPEDARIITACATIIRPGARPDVHNWLVQPERDIPAEATQVHGITTEYGREHGVPRTEAIPDLIKVLEFADMGSPMIIHNAPYDLTLLDRELRRLGGSGINVGDDGLPMLGNGGHTFPVLDTLVLDKHVDPYRPGKGGRQLTPASAVYGVQLGEDDAHSAESDVRASVQMALAIARRCSMRHDDLVALYPGRRKPHEIAANFATLRDIPLARLHELQIEWAREQAAGLAEWARKNPDKTDINPDEVAGEWPVRWIKETT